MDKFEATKTFVDGAKTGIDWMSHRGACEKHEQTEYQKGFRHCLDAIGGFMEDLVEEAEEVKQ